MTGLEVIFTRGETKPIRYVFRDADTGAVLSLTGYTRATFELASKPGGTVLAAGDTSTDPTTRINVSGSGGYVEFFLTLAESLALVPGRYSFSAFVILGGYRITPDAPGTLIVRPGQAQIEA